MLDHKLQQCLWPGLAADGGMGSEKPHPPDECWLPHQRVWVSSHTRGV